VDPDGEAVMAIPLIPVAIEGLKTAIITVGAILSGILLGNLATDIINDSQDESENQKAESVKQQLESNAQATSPSPVPPDDDPNNDDDFDKNNNSGNNKKYREKTRNANANDRKQVDSIAKKFNLNRREFGDFIEDTKQSMGRKPSDNFSYQELEILAKEFMELQ